jgi:lipopolysaccharide transport system permease protein
MPNFVVYIKSLVPALWRYRGFVLSMVAREFRGRYLNSLLGSVWSVLNPLAMVFIYTIIFSKIMRARLVGTDDSMAYGVFLCAGLLTWGYFAELLSRCQTVFIEQGNLMKKVNFPRITLPVILLLSSTVNFAIIFSIFIFFLVIIGRFPGWSIFGFLPLLILQQSIALGLGILLGTMNVFFRDIGHLIGIALQFWFWLTPVIYPVTILPERARQIVALNPMTNIVGSYQQIILYGKWPMWQDLVFQLILAICALFFGLLTFRRLSGDLVDEL